MSLEKENIHPASPGGAVVENDLQLLSYLPISYLCRSFENIAGGKHTQAN